MSLTRKLRRSNKKRFKTRLKAFTKKYAKGEITLDDIKASLASYNGHLGHGHAWKLKKHVYSGFVLHKTELETGKN